VEPRDREKPNVGDRDKERKKTKNVSSEQSLHQLDPSGKNSAVLLPSPSSSTSSLAGLSLTVD
jgi:hypothetical protein